MDEFERLNRKLKRTFDDVADSDLNSDIPVTEKKAKKKDILGER